MEQFRAEPESTAGQSHRSPGKGVDALEAHPLLAAVQSPRDRLRYIDAALIVSGFRTMRGYVRPRATQISLLRALGSARVSEFSRGLQRLMSAGVLLAKVRTNDIEAALRFAQKLEDEGPTDADIEASQDTVFIFEAALATTYIAAGLPASVMPHVLNLKDLAHDLEEPVWLYRALGFEAAAYAHSGEIQVADDTLLRMREVGAAHGFDHTAAGLAEFIARTASCMIAFTRMDIPRLEGLIVELEDTVQSDPVVRPLLNLTHGILAISRGESHAALTYLAQVTSGAERKLAPQLIQHFALSLQALTHIARGEHELALREVEHTTANADHVICPGYVRSTALIRARDFQGALRVTNECMRIRAEHNPWALGPVLMRRAVANLRLDNTEQALLDGFDALRLAHGEDNTLLFMSIPSEDVTALFDAMLAAQPDSLPELSRLREHWTRVFPATQSPAMLPKLTERESVVAHYLAGDLTLDGIARELGVSAGTVKSQTHAIYKKLGVGTRADAVRALGRSGFFNQVE